MARYDKGGGYYESLPNQGDHAQDAGSQGAEDGGQHVQPTRGGTKVRQQQGGRGGGRGARPGGGYRGGVRGQGQAKGDQGYRGARKNNYNNGYRSFPDQGKRDNSFRGGRGDGDRGAMRPGNWRQPNRNNFKQNNYNYSNSNNGSIPVITSSSSFRADAGNSSYGGWNDWNTWEDWDVDNDDYQQGHGDGQELSWEYLSNTPYESSTRVPYQRDVDDGGKRKNLTKLNNKASKKAKVENEPKK
jgi:hypothetical protein